MSKRHHLVRTGASLGALLFLFAPACGIDTSPSAGPLGRAEGALERGAPSTSLLLEPTTEEVPCAPPDVVLPPSPSDALVSEQGFEPAVYQTAEQDGTGTLVFSGAAGEPTGVTRKTTSLNGTLSGSPTANTRGDHDDFDYTDTPGSCEEQGLVQFGPLPQGMPPVDFPIFNWCDGTECPQVALAWVRTHHAAWRLSQMFEFMNDLHPEQRAYVWDRPGVTSTGDAANSKSRPSRWFGPYDPSRFQAALEAVRKYWTTVSTAKAGATDLRLQCPSAYDQEFHPCLTAPSFGTSPLGMHITKGYMNVCPPAFQTPPYGSYATKQERVDATVAHEPLHHIFTNGEALTDAKVHWHGDTCGGTPDTAKLYLYGIEVPVVDPLLSHFTDYRAPGDDDCGHHDQLVHAVDTYAQFARSVGTLVRQGDMVAWPKWADPTPTPPSCVGDIGCLCEETAFGEPPDGNYLPTTYCEDNEAEPTVCMKTKFNASDTVGICVNCGDHRGPGCPCHPLAPCDEGSCYGQDSGPGNMTGTCYGDEPPAFVCLANCEGVMGPDAFCMTDHPGGGRCVPQGTPTPDAHNCWEGGGYIDPEGDCAQYECGPLADLAADPPITCQDRGYPNTYKCDEGTFRCVRK